VRLKDVDEAQAAIVVMAKDMAAQGQIVMQDGREEEMVY
jgi:flagellar motor switch protein FliG